MYETEYILLLTAVDYVDRLTKQLALPETVEETKNLLRNGDVFGYESNDAERIDYNC